MVVVLNRDEAKRLQDSIIRLSRRTENFSHPVHRPGLRLKRDFDKVAAPQRLGQAQQASGHGNGLEFSFGTTAVFQTNRSQD